MIGINSYCFEKLEFMRDEFERIESVLNLTVFKTGKVNKDLSAFVGEQEILTKDANLSLCFRLKGNAIFKKNKHTLKEHLEIWNSYSQSIACAPNGSTELAQGYHNRSFLFFHLEKYQECIEDINKAFALEKCDENLKTKLNNLKSKCLAKLGEIESNKILNDSKTVTSEAEIQIIDKNAKIPCSSDAVSIDFNNQYGRFLVANRDIEPGELIVKEKFYSKIVNGDQIMRHCWNCCKLTYSSIPCNQCAYAMYCSEKCKIEAWSDSHEIECILMDKIDFRNTIFLCVVFSLKILMKILKQVESIDLLKAKLEKIDRCSDPWKIGFSEGTYQSNDWSSILSLSIPYAGDAIKVSYLQQVSLFSTACMYWLGRETNIFGKKMNTAAEFLKNDTAIFFAKILSRLQHIITINVHGIAEQIDEQDRRMLKDVFKDSMDHMCVEIGPGLAAFSSLFNHSCYPDVIPMTNNNGEILFFALKPIKKGSQIFNCYGVDAMAANKSKRVEDISRYGFTCNCIACKENWPTIAKAKKLFPGVQTISVDQNKDFKTNLAEVLKIKENLLKDHKPFYKEIYTAHAYAVTIFNAIYSNWCKVPSCE